MIARDVVDSARAFRTICLLSVLFDERGDALIILGGPQHHLPLAWPHRERQFAEFFCAVSEDASFV